MQVDIEKIIPVTEARDNFNKIVDEVEGTDHVYVLTKNGKPSAVIVGVNHLEKLTGDTHDAISQKVEESNTVDTTEIKKPFVAENDVVATPSDEPVPAPDTIPAPTAPPPTVAPDQTPATPPASTPAVEDPFAMPATPPKDKPAPAPDNTPAAAASDEPTPPAQ